MLNDLGVKGVINMCAEYPGPVMSIHREITRNLLRVFHTFVIFLQESSYSRLGLKQLRLPTDDHYEPALADMQVPAEIMPLNS